MRGILVPHAAPQYSGEVAKVAYAAVPKDVETIILIAPSHYETVTKTRAPKTLKKLGNFEIDYDIDLDVDRDDSGFLDEHAITTQIPFISETFDPAKTKIVPLLWGSPIALPKNAFYIISDGDVSHYESAPSLEEVIKIDMEKLFPDIKRLSLSPLDVLRNSFGIGYLLSYSNSLPGQEVRGQKLVTYAAVLYDEKETPISQFEADELIKQARIAINTRDPNYIPILISGKMKSRDYACFITLKRNGNLAGCIGTLETGNSIWENVSKYAYKTAFEDPRFTPPNIPLSTEYHITLSILEERRFITKDEYFNSDKYVPGRDGIELVSKGRSAYYLPDVYEEHGMTKQSQIEQLFKKAGVPQSENYELFYNKGYLFK